MRKLIFILPFLIFAGCKKEASSKIPLHDGSSAWLMSLPTGYANNSGDTLFTSGYSEVSEYVSENIVPNQLPPYTESERLIQSFNIGTDLTYQTLLLAEISNDLTRGDIVIVELKTQGQSSAQMYGSAEPNYGMILTPLQDTVVLNNVIYQNVYSESNNQSVEMFVNLDIGLVGFTLDADTFNIVN